MWSGWPAGATGKRIEAGSVVPEALSELTAEPEDLLFRRASPGLGGVPGSLGGFTGLPFLGGPEQFFPTAEIDQAQPLAFELQPPYEDYGIPQSLLGKQACEQAAKLEKEMRGNTRKGGGYGMNYLEDMQVAVDGMRCSAFLEDVRAAVRQELSSRESPKLGLGIRARQFFRRLHNS